MRQRGLSNPQMSPPLWSSVPASQRDNRSKVVSCWVLTITLMTAAKDIEEHWNLLLFAPSFWLFGWFVPPRCCFVGTWDRLLHAEIKSEQQRLSRLNLTFLCNPWIPEKYLLHPKQTSACSASDPDPWTLVHADVGVTRDLDYTTGSTWFQMLIWRNMVTLKTGVKTQMNWGL